MVRMAAEHGTTDLVATPHANPNYRFDPQLVQERLAEVSAASGNVLRLHSGCDFHLSFDNIQDAHRESAEIYHQSAALSDGGVFRPADFQ